MLRDLARNWWLILAGLAGTFQIVGAGVVGTQRSPLGNPPELAAAVVLASAGVLTFAGLVWRRRSRIGGDALIAVGALPLLPWYWMIVPPLVGLVVVVAAVTDIAVAWSLGAVEAGGGRKGALAIAAVAGALLLVVFAWGPGPEWAGLMAAAIVVAIVFAVFVRWTRRRST